MNEKNIRDEHDEIEIDLGKLLRHYLRHWKAILVTGAGLAALAFLVTFFLITPLYHASVTVYVNNTTNSSQVEAITGGNLSAAQQLVNTYVNIIKSNTVLNQVIEQGHLDVTPQYLRDIMTAEQVEDTEMFRVIISHPKAEDAAHIANTLADVAPALISQFVEGSSTKIIDYAVVPAHPYTPSYKKNIVLGALLGFIIMGGMLTLQYLFDMRLEDEDDIRTYFDLPVLGQIPVFPEVSRHKKKGVASLEYSMPANDMEEDD